MLSPPTCSNCGKTMTNKPITLDDPIPGPPDVYYCPNGCRVITFEQTAWERIIARLISKGDC